MIDDGRLPYFHCYPGKLLGALAGMKPDQQLVYLVVLLRIYEVRGPCPDTLEALSRRVGINRRRVSDGMDALFRDGKLLRVAAGIMNPFSEKVLAHGTALHERLARAGAKGGSTAAKKHKINQPETPSPAAPPDNQEDLDKDTLFSNEKREDARPSDAWPSGAFERFWAKYPNKVGKGAAEKSFAKIDRRRVAWGDFWRGLQAYVAKTDDRPWCNPATWLNQHRWKDEPAAVARAARETTNGAASLLVKMMEGRYAPDGTDVESERTLPARHS